MDATFFRWVLVGIAIVVALAIYLYSLHQTRLRRRSAIDDVTREEIDSAFIEDEQLRDELDNLNQILLNDEDEDNLEPIQINAARDMQKTPYALPDPEIYLPPQLQARDEEQVISYHLRHGDFRLITGEEAQFAVHQAGLELAADGLLEYREDDELLFQVASLSEPGHFQQIDQLDFSTLGFNCFIDLDTADNARLGYEAMLRKIDELVRALNVKVYQPSQDLLTISDVTEVRENLAEIDA